MIGRATLIGSQAGKLFARPGYRGRVLAVVSDAVYLSDDEGEITWIAREGLPAHTRGVLASFEPPQVAVEQYPPGPGSTFSVRWPHLRIGDSWEIDLETAAEWRPPALEPGQAAAPALVSARGRQLLAAIHNAESIPPKGLGRIVPLIPRPDRRNRGGLAAAEGRDVGLSVADLPGGADPLIEHASGPVAAIARACLERDMACIEQAGRELVGLGPGLTPAGDDFLGGLLFIAHHLAAAYPADLHWEERPGRELLAWAHTRTNRISYVVLKDMAAGLGPEPLHELVISLLRGQEVNRLMPQVVRLTAIGHSSGWDILAGVLTGTLLNNRGLRS